MSNVIYGLLLGLASGFLVGILATADIHDSVPTWAQSQEYLYLDGRKCMIFPTEYRGTRMYSVHCNDGSVTLTTNYLYID